MAKQKKSRLQLRLEFLHREAERADRLKKRGWVIESLELPPETGKYEVWLKIDGQDCFGRYANYDGHSWYSELWSWWCSSGDDEIYAWRFIR